MGTLRVLAELVNSVCYRPDFRSEPLRTQTWRPDALPRQEPSAENTSKQHGHIFDLRAAETLPAHSGPAAKSS